MAVTYYTSSQLDSFLAGSDHHLDASVRSDLIAQLNSDGTFTSPSDSAWTQFDTKPGTPPFAGGAPAGFIQVLDITKTAGSTNQVAVESTSELKAIVFEPNDPSHLTLTGTFDEFIAMGTGSDSVTLNDSGDDTVLGGAGDDSITGGAGSSSLVGGSGDDTLVGGSGDSTLLGGNGTDTLTAGTGDQTLIGEVGDTFNAVAGASGNNTFILNDGPGAGSSLTGGLGNDTFDIQSKVGNDTVTGGGGSDTISFGDRSITDIDTISSGAGGDWTITFKDGQVIEAHGITELQFGNDHQTITPP